MSKEKKWTPSNFVKNRMAVDEPIVVSVVTVCLNAVETIDETVASVLEQSYPYIEYVVIDGVSTDGTVERLRSYGSAIARLISEPDTGLYNAMNKALWLVTGDVVIFLNSGDVFATNDVVKCVVDYFYKEPKVEIVYGDWWAEFSDRLLHVQPPKHLSKWKLWLKGVNHQTIFARRSAYEQVGYFNESYKVCADWDWLLRALGIIKPKISYVPLDVCIFKMGGISANTKLLVNERARIRKHFYSNSEMVKYVIGEFFLKIWIRFKSVDFRLPRVVREMVRVMCVKNR